MGRTKSAAALAAVCTTAWLLGATGAAGQDGDLKPKFKTDLPEKGPGWEASDVQVRADPRFAENCKRALGKDCGAEIFFGTAAGGLFPNVALIIDDWTNKLPAKRDLCTGTLIAKRVVLTAGHCVDGGVRAFATFGAGVAVASKVELDANSRPFVRIKPGTAEEGRVTFIKVIKHATMSPFVATFKVDLDIGLILLEADAPDNAQFAAFAATGQIDTSPSLTAVGFGLTDKKDEGIKHFVDVMIGSHACDGSVTAGMVKKADSDWYGCVTNYELVAGGLAKNSRGADTCIGDSGGPLFVKRAGDAPQASELVLAAVTSRAVSRRGLNSGKVDCGDGGIYTRADGVALQWINHILEKEWKVR